MPTKHTKLAKIRARREPPRELALEVRPFSGSERTLLPANGTPIKHDLSAPVKNLAIAIKSLSRFKVYLFLYRSHGSKQIG